MKFFFGFAAIAGLCFAQSSAQEYNYNYQLAAPSPYGSAPSYSAPSSYGSPPAYKVNWESWLLENLQIMFYFYSLLHLMLHQATRQSLPTDQQSTLDQPLATLTHLHHHRFSAQPTCCLAALPKSLQFHAAPFHTLHRSPAIQLQATPHLPHQATQLQLLHHTVKKNS